MTRRVVALIVHLTATSVGAAAAQETPGPAEHRGVYGLDPHVLASGDLPHGWILLDETPPSLEPAIAARPLLPCSSEEDPGDNVWKDEPWPGGVVPYEFDVNMTLTMQTQALAAFAVLQNLEPDITFVPRMGEGDYIHMQDDSINQSPIGHGGMLTVRIFNWNIQGIIVHELLHSLGFYHEQARSDRDLYVQIFPANIQSGEEHNFDIQGGASYHGPYDFGSIMHYGICDFTVCMSCTPGCETILPQPAYSSFQSVMGNVGALTPLDVHGVNAAYPKSWWRFVAWNTSAGTGTGTDPWQEVSSALSSAPSGARVFIMPGTYAAPALGTTAMILEAPVGGVVIQ